MSAYATKLAEAFSAKLLQQVYSKAITPFITNEDYSGDVQKGSIVDIPALGKVTQKTYSGADLSPDDLTEIVAQLTVDQFKSFYFKVKSINEYKSFIKNPANKTIAQRAAERRKDVDAFTLGFYGDVAAGHRVGTDYSTGTVTVTVTTGAVVGVGTTFTTAMVGRGFKADGHTKWYRVKTFTDTTHIVIEDDSDDEASSYTGGAIAGGASYVIEAVTPLSVTKDNIMGYLLNLKTKLDEEEGVSDEGRWTILPPVISNLLPIATNVALNVPAVYENLVKKGFITELVGFKIFSSPRVNGDNTNGYHCLAGTGDWLTFADKMLENGIEEDLIGNFGSAYKDLYIYGGKVADERRKFATELFAKV